MLPSIPDYKLLSCLHEGISSNLYRAIRLSDNYPVVIKISTLKTLSDKKAQRFRQEFQIGQQINSPHVVRYLELQQSLSYGSALIMEDDHAIELTTVIPREGLANDEFLEIAIQIVQGLQAIHAVDIIHNDLKPSNILIQPITKIVKIIDFNSASTLRQAMQQNIPRMRGTLAYISPEQTGRINRTVDYRTDFYSLGVTFYQLLCGRWPFTAKDAVGFIHQHLASLPKPLHHCKPTVALPLSQIVMKLLEKEAENRYQRCEGILYDLDFCLSTLQQGNLIPEFELGRQDFSNILTFPQHLYGRESEINTLLNTFERVSHDKSEALMVAGQAGVGKSMLIQEMQKTITLKNGYFISGKFDQLNKNVAYSALTNAFDDLIKQWLTEDEMSIKKKKERLLIALRTGTHAQLITQIVPNLASLMGQQPPIQFAEISQAKTVFNLAFLEFIQSFVDATHPLVVFLDDLQWADNASLDLMTYLMQQPNLHHLLWIGAYRDTEVTVSHPTIQAITTLLEAQVCVTMIKLERLSLDNLQQWIADSLHMLPIEVSSLTELIQQKTAGNPFFVKFFLQTLYDQHLLSFSSKNHWQWDLHKIRKYPATENVIALMSHQIQQLPVGTQEALSIASCLGHRLSWHLLQTAMACSQDVVYETLQPAFNRGILLQTEMEVYFVHDRVQEAAYCLLPESERVCLHLTLGERLLEQLSTEESWLFDTVAQFNHCCSQDIPAQRRLELARLNLKAGQKAKQAAAYVTARDYLHASQAWIDSKTLWQTDYPLAFTLYKELAEVEYLSGHADRSEDLIVDMQPCLKSVIDKIDIYHLWIIQKIVLGQLQEAIELGQEALALLDAGFPSHHPEEFIQAEMPVMKQKLANIPLLSLLNAPFIVEPEKQAIFKILADLSSGCFQLGSELLPVVTLMSIKLSLAYGHVPESCVGYVVFALLLCTQYQEYLLGYELGNLAIQLAEKLQSPVQRCRSALIMYDFIYPWSKSIQNLPDIFTSLIEQCIAYGEIEYAAYCRDAKAQMLFDQGAPLAKVQQQIISNSQFAHSTKNKGAIYNIMRSHQRVVANLMGETPGEEDFNYNEVSEAEFMAECQASASKMSLGLYCIRKAQALYLYEQFEQALQHLDRAQSTLHFILGFYATSVLNWYDSLTRLALYPSATSEVQRLYLQQVEKNQKQLQRWQASCVENFTSKYHLVAAELARIKRDYAHAEEHYDHAIELAGRHQFIQEQALAAELAAKHWLARNKFLCAQGYVNTAFNGYTQWGAKRKLILFKKQFADVLKVLAPPHLSQLMINSGTTLSGNTLKLLDLSSIIKASQAISSEIELPKLLRSMMQIIIENAGAQQGALLFVEEDETIFVQAESRGGLITTLQNIPMAHWTHGSHAVIQYVKRLRHPLVLDNAVTHEQFKADPYINQTQTKSVLCIPLMVHAVIKAILYLENNVISQAFTSERVQTILILSSQMTISLENAGHFAKEIALARQIEEKDQQRELALRSANMGTWKWNLEDNTVDVGDRLLALYGVTRENFESTNENFITLIHPDDRASVKKATDRTLEEGLPFEIEFRVFKPSDHSVHILAGRADVVRDSQGQPKFMIGVNWDITQQKQLENDKLLNAVLRASQTIQSGTLFYELATMGQDWGAVKKELVMGESPCPGVIPSLSKEGVALEHMKGLVEYRDILDYTIYQQAVKAIFPPSHYEIVSKLKESEEGYTFIVYNRADAFKKSNIFEMKLEPIKSELSSERPCCEIKVTAPGSRTLTSDIDTSIYVVGATGAHSLDVTFADAAVRNRGPDYNGRVRNQVIAHFYRISEELHHMTSSISRDSNAYADTITDDEKEYPKFNFTPDNNPIINGHFIIQDPLFYAEYKLTKHYQEQAASIIPILRALTAEEWGTFKDQTLSDLQNRLKSIYSDKRHEDYFNVSEIDLKQIFSLAETLHQEAEQTISQKTEQVKKERAEYWESSPLCKSPERLAMDMKISAMNRLYVDYLEKVIDTHNEIINLKQKQEDLVLQLEQLHLHQNEINKKLSDKNTEEELLLAQQTCNVLSQQIKTIEQQLLIHLKQKAYKFLQKQALQIKANLFAHEAYINRSAVHHVVNGMLLYKGKISLSKQTIMGSALQQIGFRLGHANQLRVEHKSEGEIAYYCAKYSHRVFDLLFNNNESPIREAPYTEKQIESLTKDSTHNNLNVLARLKVAELQSKLHLFFTQEEYQLLNSEMKIIAHVKKGDISEREKPERAKELIKERMCLIDKDTYLSLKKITDEELQFFTKTTEKNLFISVAIKLMVAVYIAKLELKKGYLWSQISTVQPTLFSLILQPEASNVEFSFDNNRLKCTPTLFPNSPNVERLNTSKNITNMDNTI